ncbi:MAG: leucyl aminopeptidase family protein [Kineosporiaceae bacterium]
MTTPPAPAPSPGAGTRSAGWAAPPAPELRLPDRPLAQMWSTADVVAVGVGRPAGAAGPEPGLLARAVAYELEVDLAAVLAVEKVGGRAGDVTRLPEPPSPGRPARVLLLGVGGGEPTDLRRAGSALARAARGRGDVVTDLATGAPEAAVCAAVEGLLLGGWSPPAVGLKDRSDAAVPRTLVLSPDLPRDAVERGRAHAAATLLARWLAVTPADVKDPVWVAAQAVDAGLAAGLEVEVWDERRLAAEGFGGLLAVGGGSARPPRLVRLEYRPAAPAMRGGPGTPDAALERPIVLVGKGITFDTGGLDVKPREAMVPMKTDMSGAAAVLAALVACPGAGVRRRVVGLLPLAENALGAGSYRPGDVVRQYGGRTTEVVNTDAEGRVVMADAIAFADAHLDPAVIVDVATLTGAAYLGLGRRHAAVFTPDDDLAAALLVAGADAGERAWRMPLVEDYRPALDSTLGDIRQAVTEPGFGAGAVTAALFLREFAGGRRWAHLDIAGPARSDKEEQEVPKGATGFGARLLLRWLEQREAT